MLQSKDNWWVYIIRTAKGQLYTGIAKDVQARFEKHVTGKGARFLRGKGPLELVYVQVMNNHSEALKMEIKIKKMPRTHKIALIKSRLG